MADDDIGFESEDLRREVEECLLLLPDFNCSAELAEAVELLSVGDRAVIGASTLIPISIPKCDSYALLPAQDLVDFVRCASGVWDGIYLVGKKEAFVHLTPSNDAAIALVNGAPIDEQALVPRFASTFAERDVALELALVFGATPVALAVAKSGHYHSYHLPFYSSDSYIWIQHDQADRRLLERAVAAYLYELASSCQVEFEIASRLEGDFPDHNFDQLVERGNRLRPLLVGPGMEDLTKLYLTAVGAAPEHQIVAYAKVVEYVAATAARIQNLNQTRLKLMSPRALQPDAEFVSQLTALVESQAEWRDDRKAIEKTIVLCCDPLELRADAPPFCEKLARLSIDSSEQEKADALEDLASRLHDTRNQLSHAKANYKRKGKECAPEQLEAFANLARVAAEQAIRWFSVSDPALRHVFAPMGRR